MNVEHLVSMANQIGRYYEAYPDRAEALKSAATHVRRYWDPRMRTALLHHMDADNGEWKVGADATLETLLGSEPLRKVGALFAVDRDGRLRGVVTIDQVRRALETTAVPGA